MAAKQSASASPVPEPRNKRSNSVVQTKNPVFGPRWGLEKLLLSPKLHLVSAMGEAIHSDEFDVLAKALLPVFESHGDVLHLIHFLVKEEMANTLDAATLFRGTSLTTKLVSYFCKKEGLEYLRQILNPLIKMFCIDAVNIEVDPNKSKNGKIELAQQQLLIVSQGLLGHIFRSVNKCSTAMRRLFNLTQQEVMNYFPDHKRRVVGGFFFLRFLCPALVTPEHWGIVKEPPLPESRRSLILVSKIVQNLANDCEFGEKEPYMICMNPFITTNIDAVSKFLDVLATVPEDEIVPSVKPTDAERELALDDIYQILKKYKDKVVAALGKRGKQALAQKLTKALEIYTPLSTK